MTVERRSTRDIRLIGTCPVEEAETLLAALLASPEAVVDWSACTGLHTAVVQVLLAARPLVRGTCQDPFVARWIAPMVVRGPGGDIGSAGQPGGNHS